MTDRWKRRRSRSLSTDWTASCCGPPTAAPPTSPSAPARPPSSRSTASSAAPPARSSTAWPWDGSPSGSPSASSTPPAKGILRSGRAVDCSYAVARARGVVRRFRCNLSPVLAGHGFGIDLAMRVLPDAPPTLEALGVEDGVAAAWDAPRGPHSGHRRARFRQVHPARRRTRRLLERGAGPHQSYEAPIEFTFDHVAGDGALMSSSEIPRHFPSFAEGLRSSLRRRPAAVVVGEARDRETVEAVVRAADYGIAVYATAHTVGVAAAVRRLLAEFPPEERHERGAAPDRRHEPGGDADAAAEPARRADRHPRVARLRRRPQGRAAGGAPGALAGADRRGRARTGNGLAAAAERACREGRMFERDLRRIQAAAGATPRTRTSHGRRQAIDGEETTMEAPNAPWRDTMRSVRFYTIDARLLIPMTLWLFVPAWWTTAAVVLTAAASASREGPGIPASAPTFRAVRAWTADAAMRSTRGACGASWSSGGWRAVVLAMAVAVPGAFAEVPLRPRRPSRSRKRTNLPPPLPKSTPGGSVHAGWRVHAGEDAAGGPGPLGRAGRRRRPVPHRPAATAWARRGRSRAGSTKPLGRCSPPSPTCRARRRRTRRTNAHGPCTGRRTRETNDDHALPAVDGRSRVDGDPGDRSRRSRRAGNRRRSPPCGPNGALWSNSAREAASRGISSSPPAAIPTASHLTPDGTRGRGTALRAGRQPDDRRSDSRAARRPILRHPTAARPFIWRTLPKAPRRRRTRKRCSSVPPRPSGSSSARPVLRSSCSAIRPAGGRARRRLGSGGRRSPAGSGCM